jgi:heat shock protein HtpX
MYDQITVNKFKSAAMVGVFVLLVLAAGWAFGYVTEWGAGGLVLALIFSFAMAWGSYWYSDRIVLSMSRAVRLIAIPSRTLSTSSKVLSIAAGLPVAQGVRHRRPAPNAFATGRNPGERRYRRDPGLMEKLDRLELEGVVAHELAHVKNYDTLVQTMPRSWLARSSCSRIG